MCRTRRKIRGGSAAGLSFLGILYLKGGVKMANKKNKNRQDEQQNNNVLKGGQKVPELSNITGPGRYGKNPSEDY